MVDSGSGPNLLKIRSLHPSTKINHNEILRLTGITAQHVLTRGQITLEILGLPAPFHLVDDSFPIAQEGIVGSDFLKRHKAHIDYENELLKSNGRSIPFQSNERIIIPARSRARAYVIATNPEIGEGYVPRLKFRGINGLYLGDALVKVINGKAHLDVINTNDRDVELVIPKIKIQEFSSVNTTAPVSEAVQFKSKSSNSPDNRDNPPNSLNQSILQNPLNSSTNPNRSNQATLPISSNHFPQGKRPRVTTPKISSTCFNIKNACIERAAKIQNLLNTDHLNPEERTNLQQLILEYSDCFHLPDEPLGYTTVTEHHIPTTDDRPINRRQYRFPPIHKDEIKRQVTELLDNGIIKPSESPYNTPVWVVPKKPDSQGNKRWRMVLDFRALNEKTVSDAYPLPNIVEILDQLGGAKYFSVFDLASGFHQIRMKPEDSRKTAFTTPHGHYEFERMPFGLKNAPATFQRLMDRVLTGLQGNEMFVYLDDIVIYSSSLREHEIKFRKLMDRLRRANLQLQPEKCQFLRKEVCYLGHIIGAHGVRPDPGKILAVKNFPVPKTEKNVKQFLGLAGYYRRFIPNFSRIAKPLTRLLKKDEPFQWTERQHEAFEILRDELCKEPVLQYPDFNKPFLLTTDASDFAIGGILSQGSVGKDKPIAYASRVLNSAELNYPTIQKELLAIVYCIQHFRPYLYGKKFTLVTDHKPLTWLHSVEDPTSRLMRWRLKLAEYEYDILYKAGKANVNADALSRNPVEHVPETSYPIRSGEWDDITTESEDEETIAANRNPVKLKTPPPQTAQMREEVEPIVSRPNPRTRSQVNQDPGGPIPFTEKERREPPFKQHVVGAQVHRNPSRESSFLSQGTVTPDYDDVPLALRLNRTTPRIEPATSSYLSPQSDAGLGTPARSTPLAAPDQHQPFPNLENRTIRRTLFDGRHVATDNPFESEDDDTSSTENELQEQRETRSAGSIVLNQRDKLWMRKDNSLYFVTANGRPADNGSQQLADRNQLPKLRKPQVGDAVFIKRGNKHDIAIICKLTENDQVLKETLVNAFQALGKQIRTRQLETITIAKTKEIDGITWQNIIALLRSAVAYSGTKIIVCHGTVQEPEEHRRQNILEEAHCSTVGGHKGVTKTYNRIRQRFYWEHLKDDVQNFVRGCARCQLKKITRNKTKQPMIITDTPESAFDKVSMDMVGPLPRTTDGNEYLLTIQDNLTKYSLAIPMKSGTATSVAKALVKRFFSIFGPPKSILTDRGTNFTSLLLKHLSRYFRVTQYRTTAFHPQSNGSLERSHAVLADYLKQYVDSRHEWDEFPELATFSYNTSIHESTGFTPYELVFGKIARQPSSEPYNEDRMRTYGDYLTDLIQTMHGIRQIARDNLVESKLKSKTYYDRKINPQIFQPSDPVFLLKEPKRGKLSDNYTGPYRIHEVLGNNNVKIFVNGKARTVHTNKLKLAHIPTDNK
ncbi:Retrovirus-related Pol polyprotein from transposon 17.6 [Anthophora plagiata]